MAWKTRGAERFRWAEKALRQSERDGFYWFGICCTDGDGCEEKLEMAKKNYLIAAKLDFIWGMKEYGFTARGKRFTTNCLAWESSCAGVHISIHFRHDRTDGTV
jgi:hypothetical protein